MKKNKTKKYHNRRAFSLMETIISVFIVSVGIVSIFPLIGKSLTESMDSRDQMLASFLAQEGVELVENIRDNNWAEGIAGEEALTEKLPGVDRNRCIISYDTTQDLSSSSSCGRPLGDTALNLNSSNFYTHSSGTSTKFHRRVNFDYEGSGDDMTVTVTSFVIWGRNFPSNTDLDDCNTATKCAYARTTLTQWWQASMAAVEPSGSGIWIVPSSVYCEGSPPDCSEAIGNYMASLLGQPCAVGNTVSCIVPVGAPNAGLCQEIACVEN